MRLRAALAAALCLCLAGCGGGALPFMGGGGGSGVVHGPVKVALVDVFSGTSPYASQGTLLQNSLQIEIDAVNAQGGLLGNQVQLVTADDQLDPPATPSPGSSSPSDTPFATPS